MLYWGHRFKEFKWLRLGLTTVGYGGQRETQYVSTKYWPLTMTVSAFLVHLLYISSWNCQKLTAEQPLRGQAVHKFPSHYKPRHPPSFAPGRMPVHVSILAIGHRQLNLQLIPYDMMKRRFCKILNIWHWPKIDQMRGKKLFFAPNTPCDNIDKSEKDSVDQFGLCHRLWGTACTHFPCKALVTYLKQVKYTVKKLSIFPSPAGM